MAEFYVFILFCWILVVEAYQTISDNFLRNISSRELDFNPTNGTLLAPLLRASAAGAQEKSLIQHHLVGFFALNLPRWTLTWHNSTAVGPGSSPTPISNLVFRREPPWTKPGQANFLTLAAHYNTRQWPSRLQHNTSGAVSCALLMRTYLAKNPRAYTAYNLLSCTHWRPRHQ